MKFARLAVKVSRICGDLKRLRDLKGWSESMETDGVGIQASHRERRRRKNFRLLGRFKLFVAIAKP